MKKKLVFNLVALMVIAIGTVWTLQGMNVLLGSVMSGQSVWVRNGLIVAAIGFVLLLWNNLRGRAKRTES